MEEAVAEMLIVELARSLHASGSPAYELDQRMEAAAAALNKPAKFFSTPTALFITFDDQPANTRLLRVYPSDTNLGRYADLYDLQQEVQQGKLSVSGAWQRLLDIRNQPDSYPASLQIIAYALVGASVGVLVGGDASVSLAAGVIALVVGVMVISLTRQGYPAHLINVIAGFATSTVACLLQVLQLVGQFELVSLSALIVLVPGLNLTISINELATQNLASGSARIAGALTTLLTLVFGVFLGFTMVDAVADVPPSLDAGIPDVLTSTAVIAPIGLSLAVLFRARYRDIGWVLVSVVIAYTTLRVAGAVFSSLGAVWIASLVAGLTSRLVSKTYRFPTSVMLMPGLLLLVPGSLGFSGLSQIMLSEDIPSGVQLIVTMMLTSGAIVAGLLLSEVIAPPSDDV